MTYRPAASALHAARAAVACAYCAALGIVALISAHPLVLGSVVMATLAAGHLAGVGRELRRAALLALPFALLVALINPLVTRDGLTVIARAGEVPVLGRLDITLEATVNGGVLGLRALALILACALYAATVDPDEMLRLFRRVSFRSALTATLATRMLPVLGRDARRLSEAQRCRPDARAPRLAVVRATAANALDRAVDVAATLELRGYAAAARPPRTRRAWSRHDLGFAGAAAALVALGIAAGAGGLAGFQAYPRLDAAFGPTQVAVAGALAVCALLPFSDRRGIGR